jgi:hypothetical protein
MGSFLPFFLFDGGFIFGLIVTPFKAQTLLTDSIILKPKPRPGAKYKISCTIHATL